MELVIDNKLSRAAGLKGVSIHIPRPRLNTLTRGLRLGSTEVPKAPIKTVSVPKSVPKSVEKPATDVIAGGVSRSLAQATIHPIDTIKVRMQATDTVKEVFKVKKTNPLGRMVQGVPSLYKGCGSAACCAGIIIAAHFAFYGTTSKYLKENTDMPVGSVAFIAGGVGAFGSCFLKIPMAVCIRSVQANVYPNVFVAAKQITKGAGARALYTGMLPALLEDIPDTAVKFASYEMLRATHSKVTGKGRTEASIQEDLAMGGLSGALAAAATTPFDVVKTRMMCTAAKRPTLMSASMEVWKMGGVKPFFTGVVPRAVSSGMNSAIFFMFFEAIRGVINDKIAEDARVEGAKPK